MSRPWQFVTKLRVAFELTRDREVHEAQVHPHLQTARAQLRRAVRRPAQPPPSPRQQGRRVPYPPNRGGEVMAPTTVVRPDNSVVLPAQAAHRIEDRLGGRGGEPTVGFAPRQHAGRGTAPTTVGLGAVPMSLCGSAAVTVGVTQAATTGRSRSTLWPTRYGPASALPSGGCRFSPEEREAPLPR